MARTEIEVLQSQLKAALAIEAFDDRVVKAQEDMEFEEGIKVVNEVVAEFVASLAHLFDYHGQNFGEMLSRAQAIYLEESSRAEAEDGSEDQAVLEMISAAMAGAGVPGEAVES